ncbi:MAG: thioredoxin domain-containing protein [Planctomycetota bacterium]
MNPLVALVAAGFAAPALMVAHASSAASAKTGWAADAPIAAVQTEAEAPKLLVVKFHADWCGKCKALSQPLIDARANVVDKPVLFIEMDFTDRNTSRQSEFLASVAGLESTWAEYERRTGFALLIDASSGSLLEMLSDPDAQAITDAINKHL